LSINSSNTFKAGDEQDSVTMKENFQKSLIKYRIGRILFDG